MTNHLISIRNGGIWLVIAIAVGPGSAWQCDGLAAHGLIAWHKSITSMLNVFTWVSFVWYCCLFDFACGSGVVWLYYVDRVSVVSIPQDGMSIHRHIMVDLDRWDALACKWPNVRIIHNVWDLENYGSRTTSGPDIGVGLWASIEHPRECDIMSNRHESCLVSRTPLVREGTSSRTSRKFVELLAHLNRLLNSVESQCKMSVRRVTMLDSYWGILPLI